MAVTARKRQETQEEIEARFQALLDSDEVWPDYGDKTVDELLQEGLDSAARGDVIRLSSEEDWVKFRASLRAAVGDDDEVDPA